MANTDTVEIDDWFWVQDYLCFICNEECAVGYSTKDAIQSTVECDNCGYDMVQVEADDETG